MEKSVYEVIQIDDTSWRIEENAVRSFLFAGTEKALLIDTGLGTGDLRSAVRSLTNLPVTLINTHGDHDHTGCNKQFEDIYMHPDEFDHYREENGGEPAAKPIREGDEIDLGNRRFEIILIPGHTPGSIALLDAENRVLIAGDSVQAGTIFMAGSGRDMKDFISSLKKLRDMSGRYDFVYASHGPFPVSTGIITELICGAEKIIDGSLQGECAPPPFDMCAKIYDVIAAKIVC